MATHKHRGFTFIELLVVLCAIVLAMATLVPAMQQARFNSQHSQCVNNLKNIALALHNYHDVFGCFAPGWVSRRPDGNGHASNGWQVFLLPYINQAPLYNRLNMDAVYEGDEMPLLRTDLTLYRCPVDALPGTNPLRGGWGTSNYSGNYGSTPISRWSDLDHWPGQVPPATLQSDPPPNGIFHANSRVGLRDITDGTSNTFLVGERSVMGRGGIWPGPRSNFHEWDVVTDGSHASPLNGVQGFSSRHVDGSVVVLCDGAVRTIRPDLDSQPENGLLQKLCDRQDNQPVGEF